MRGASVAVVAVLAILTGAGAGYLVGNVNGHPAASVSTFTTTSVTTTTVISTGLLTTTATVTSTVHSTDTAPSLGLFGSVSPPAIASGQNVSLNLGVFNPLHAAVTVNVPPTADPYSPGCAVPRPDFWDLFAGHITFSNLSSSKPLLLYNASGFIPCFAYDNSTFTFYPDSDLVNATGLGSVKPLTWSHTYNYSGYWVPSSDGDKFLAFPPGLYTALFLDIWGQRLLEYFTVAP